METLQFLSTMFSIVGALILPSMKQDVRNLERKLETALNECTAGKPSPLSRAKVQ